MNKTRRLLLIRSGKAALFSIAAGVSAMAASVASAQQYPAKPIRLMVPFGPGGAVDIVARVIGAELVKHLGQPVIVENRTGAGGNVAASFVAKSDADGYTLLMGSTGNSVNGSLYTNLNYDPDRDLLPIALVGSVGTVLLAHPALPANTVSELLALAKGAGDTLNFASGGGGTTEHLAAEMFNTRAGTSIKHIPYRGGAPALTDLQAGRVQLMFTNQLNALPHLKAGTLKALGMASAERTRQLPNVPTFGEQGMPEFIVSVWWGIFGPANLQGAVVERFNQSVNAALASPDVLARLESVGAVPLGGSAAQFASFFAKESAKWRAVVRAGNIKAE
ncbi:MAG: tripartite tricarboxylate transporter substrate binding protein [Betaproteobacteria bacterium]|nr:tripartite tricarboxylate transporter substrate binding protein [Betaproteobacteria bacterium]